MRFVSALDSRPAFRLLQMFAAVALLLSVFVGFRQVQLTDCLADYNEAANRATTARTLAAEQDRLAQDEMFRAISQDPQSAVRAIQAYAERRRAADEQRRRNPLPAPPSQRC